MSTAEKTGQVEQELSGDWLTLWLNRPHARNALTEEMIEELGAVLRPLRDDRSVRGVTLRGRGGVFCAGGDLKGFRAALQGSADPANVKDAVKAANRRAGELFGLLEQMPQVVVMLVEGAAIAGGLGMVCAGDLVVATRDTKFALTETMLGIPPAQIAPFVVRRLGLPAARRLMLTAQRFDGEAALALGLADELVDDAEALEQAEAAIRRQVRRCAPGANAATKEILHAAARLDREEMSDFAAERFAQCMLGPEGLEGIAAFIEKRPPGWSG